MRRIEQIRDDLIEASENEECDLLVDSSPVFANKIRQYACILEENNNVTKSLQSDGHRLADCRYNFDFLNEGVEDEKILKTLLDGGHLGTKYIAADSNIVEYRAFEDAVVELQAGKQRDLTETYNTAVQKPLKPLVTAYALENIGTRLTIKNVRQKSAKCVTRRTNKSTATFPLAQLLELSGCGALRSSSLSAYQYV